MIFNGTGRKSQALNDAMRRIRAVRPAVTPGMLTSQTTGGTSARTAWRPVANKGKHPFQVYRSPSGNTDINTEDGWRKVLVRSGRVGVTGVTKTDGAEYPYSREAGVTTDEIEIAADEDNYVIWIQYAPDTENYGVSAAAEIDHAAGGWTGYPASWDTEGTIMIPIAICDTTTSGVLKIRQLVDNDLPNFIQVCVNVGGTDKVLNIPCLGYPFAFGV